MRRLRYGPDAPLDHALLIAALLAQSAAWHPAQAAEPAWKPQKNVELVVGAQAGGSNDRMARLLQKVLTESGAVPASMTVVNKPGQGQILAVAYVISHPGDPHYLLMLGSSWVTSSIATRSTIAHREFSAISSQRLPQLPNLPTLREQGYDVVASTWFAVFGPKGLSPAQAAYWEDAMGKAMRHPETKRFVEANNWTIELIGSRQLPVELDKEYARLRAALSELGMVK